MGDVTLKLIEVRRVFWIVLVLCKILQFCLIIIFAGEPKVKICKFSFINWPANRDSISPEVDNDIVGTLSSGFLDTTGRIPDRS